MSTTPTIQSSGAALLEDPLTSAISHLRCALTQSIPSDDAIIIGHIQAAADELEAARDAGKEVDETELLMQALKVAHGKTRMLATRFHLIALHNSHVRTFQQINEILDGPGNEFAKLALIRKLTKAAGKGGE